MTHSFKYPRGKSKGTFIGSHQPRYSADILIPVFFSFSFFLEGGGGVNKGVNIFCIQIFNHCVSE